MINERNTGGYPRLSSEITEIEKANDSSWYMDGTTDRPFSVAMSVYTNSRAVGGVVLAGSMGEKYNDLAVAKETWPDLARHNINRFLDSVEVSATQTKMLRPQRPDGYDSDPLRAFNADTVDFNTDGRVTPLHSADFIYTYDTETSLAVPPADCPIIIFEADTPNGEIHGMVHVPWRGADADYVEQAFHHFDALGVDQTSLRVFISAGARAESFPFSNKRNPLDTPDRELLFTDVTYDGEQYHYSIDTPNFVLAQIREHLDDYQIYVDTTDTARSDSGFSSHGAAWRSEGKRPNTRDVIVTMRHTRVGVLINPERPSPPEILKDILAVEVAYSDFDNQVQHGVIEVNKMVADDVKDFFALALESHFPIEKVVKSSDPDYSWDDDRLMAANATSGFNYRLIKGTEKPSLHGRGLAFDVNCRLNPYIRYDKDDIYVDPPTATWDPAISGTLYATHPLVVFMKERGWQWGGDWTKESGRTDYQHFEKNL